MRNLDRHPFRRGGNCAQIALSCRHRHGSESITASHPNVAEAAVVGVADALKGQVAIAFVIDKDAAGAGDAAAQLRLEGEIMKTRCSRSGDGSNRDPRREPAGCPMNGLARPTNDPHAPTRP